MNDTSNANTPSCNLMHDRAREAGSELRRTLIGLGSGSIGLLMVIFVSTDKLDYSIFQLILAGGAVLSHTITVLFGLFAWRSDAQRNYFWALKLDQQFLGDKDVNRSLRKKYQKNMDAMDKFARYAFVLGVVLIAIFVFVRLVHLS